MSEKLGYRFGWLSIINHWVSALLFLSVLGLGFYLDFIGDGRGLRGPWMGVHKALGVVFLVFAVWRLTWRLTQGFPKDVAPMPLWQKASAKIVHWALLFATIAMPVSGILLSLYSERAINVFGLLMIPAQQENGLIVYFAGAFHTYSAYLVCVVLFMHVGAVLKHHLLDRDDTLKRMLRAKVKSYQPASTAPLPQPLNPKTRAGKRRAAALKRNAPANKQRRYAHS